ncbi:MAG: response regulator, partial [Chloroflexota bacterium]
MHAAKWMVVDDHEPVRTMLCSWLQAEFEAIQFLDAASGEEALALIDQERPQVVILDVGLPGINGIEAARQIRLHYPDTFIIIHTIHDDEAYQADARLAGADRFISKRRTQSELPPVLRQLQLKQRRRAIQAGYARQAMNTCERFAQSALDALASHIAILDERGVILAVNRAWRHFAEQNGADPQKVSGGVDYLAVCAAVCGPDREQAEQAAQGIQAVLSGERDTFALEYACHSPDQPRWFTCLATRFTRSGRTRVVIKHEDITRRKVAEDQLVESNEMFRYVFEHTVVGKSITQPDGKIYVNTAFCEMLGYTVQELQQHTWQSLTHPDDLEDSRREVADLMSGRKLSTRFIKRYLHKDGTPVWAEVSASLRRDEQGRPLYMMTNIINITEQRQAEKEQHKRAAQLALINEVGKKVVSVLDIQAVLDIAANQMHDAFGYQHVALFVLDARGGDLVLQASAGWLAGIVPAAYRLRLGEGLVGRAAQQGALCLANRVEDDPHYVNPFPDLIPTRAELCLPLKAGERILGVLDVQSPQPDAFSALDVAALETLADLVAVALDNAQLYQTVQTELHERTQAEAALRQTERRYHNLFEVSPVSLWEEDFSMVKARIDELKRQGVSDFRAYLAANPQVVLECMNLIQVLDVNRATLELYGASSKDEFMRSLSHFLVDEYEQQPEIELVYIAESRRRFSWEGVNCTLDGRRINISLNWAAVSGFEDTLERVIVSVVDITERKQSEQALVEHRAHLEDVIRERTAELVVAKEQAEAASRAKSDFLAVMSHEIRTPLNGVLGLTQLALKTELSEKQRQYLNHIQLSGQILLATINDILDFSKIEAGKMDLEAVEFNLDDLLHDLVDLVAYRVEEKGLDLQLNRDPAAPRLLIGDPHRLSQVLLNLVSNAVKFTERGQVEVRVELVERGPREARLCFGVRDTGIGLSEAQIGQLFQAFSQADSSTSRKYGGTRLGLTISRRLVKMMGGEIQVESQVGAGSCFSFSIWLGCQAQPAAQDTQERRKLSAGVIESLQGRSVLVVEDNLINQMVAVSLLEEFGMRTTVAGSGEQALEMARQEMYDVVLMDIQMPGMDGYQTTLHLRRLPRPGRAYLPVIAMTAH